MTTHFPDIASYQAGLSLSGAPFVWVKATEGTTYLNPTYGEFKAQAAQKGVKFGAYHALRNGNGAGQADFAFGKVGPDVPLMLDWEDFGDTPTVATALAFCARYWQLGGLLKAIYLPRWFWQGHLGGPDLAWFAQRGCFLVSSNYTAYSDNGPGWAPYAGMEVKQWQYTAGRSFNGYSVDFNAVKMTADEWWALLTGNAEDLPVDQTTFNNLMQGYEKAVGPGNYTRMQSIWHQPVANTSMEALGSYQDLAKALAAFVGTGSSDRTKPAVTAAQITDLVGKLEADVAELQAGGVPSALVLDDSAEKAIADKVVSGLGDALKNAGGAPGVAVASAVASNVRAHRLLKGAKAAIQTPGVSLKVWSATLATTLLGFVFSALGARVPALAPALHNVALTDAVQAVVAGAIVFVVTYLTRHLPKAFTQDVEAAVADVEQGGQGS